MSIATKTGDAGQTALMYGRRVSKADRRVDVYGTVDELNAALGLARVAAFDDFVSDQIHEVQRELIIVMGELAISPDDRERYLKDGFKLTTAAMVDRLTAVIDELEKEKLLNFKGWAIPGSTQGSAALDLARTACRRTERRVVSFTADGETVNPEIIRYLNRLSDLCWLLGRYTELKTENPEQSR